MYMRGNFRTISESSSWPQYKQLLVGLCCCVWALFLKVKSSQVKSSQVRFVVWGYATGRERVAIIRTSGPYYMYRVISPPIPYNPYAGSGEVWLRYSIGRRSFIYKLNFFLKFIKIDRYILVSQDQLTERHFCCTDRHFNLNYSVVWSQCTQSRMWNVLRNVKR